MFHPDGTNRVYKGVLRETKLIQRMTSEGATSKIQVQIDHLLIYTKSRTGLFIGTLVEPLMSDGQVFVKGGENCKVKIKYDILDFGKLKHTKILEFVIHNSCEEKMLNGTFVKQFTALSVSDYTCDVEKTIKF